MTRQHCGDWLRKRIGYGDLAGAFWFLGMEEREAGRDRRTAARQAPRRRPRGSPEGIRRAIPPPGLKPVTQPTWRKLIRTLLVAKNGNADIDEIRAYQAGQWGRIGGETLLAELFPVASPTLSRDRYKERLLACRIELFRGLYRRHRPRLVIAYGKGSWEHYKAIFGGPDTRWLKLPADCGDGVAHGNVALVQHPTFRGVTNGQFEALGRWARVRSGRAW